MYKLMCPSQTSRKSKPCMNYFVLGIAHVKIVKILEHHARGDCPHLLLYMFTFTLVTITFWNDDVKQ